MATFDTPPPAAPVPPRRSNARWGWLAVPVVAIAAIPASAWVIGQRVETGYATRMAQMSREMPALAGAKVTYHRQLFSATRTTTFDLNAMYGNCFAHDAKAPRQAAVVSVVEHIEHGPFPGGSSFGAARVTYETRINGKPLAAFFGTPLGGAGGPVLTLTGSLPELVSVYGFGGGSTTTMKGPAGSIATTIPAAAPADADMTTEDGAATPPAPDKPQVVTVAWKSVDGSVDLNGSGERMKSRFTLDGFTAGVSTVRLVAGVLSYAADHTKSADAGWWLPTGSSSLKLDRVDAFYSPAGTSVSVPAFSATGFDVDGKQEIANGLAALSARMTVKTLTALGETLGPVDYDYGVSRLDAKGLHGLVETSYGPLLKGCPTPLATQDPQEKIAEMMTAMKGLLEKSPELRLDKLAVTWAGKQASLKGAARLTGVTAADLRAPDPTGLLQKGSAEGEARIDDGFIDVAAGAAAKRMVISQHQATASQAAIPPELFERMAKAQTDAEQQAAMAAITSAQATATAGLTDARLLADPAVQAEIKATTAKNIEQVHTLRDQWLAQGLLLREGAQLVVKGSFKNGQALINGKPAESFRPADTTAAEPEAGASQ